MAEETYELCLDGEGLRIIPVGEDQVSVHILTEDHQREILSDQVNILGGQEDVLDGKSLSTPLLLAQTQSMLVPRDVELKSTGVEKKPILQSISLYIEYGKEWVEDMLTGISSVQNFQNFPIYCSDGISWGNKLILGSLNARLKTLISSAGEDSCLVVPQISKAEFDTFLDYILAKDPDVDKETMKTLLKVGEIFEFPIRYISLEEKKGGSLDHVINYGAIFSQQREEFIHKVSAQTDLAKFVSKVCESTLVQSNKWNQLHQDLPVKPLQTEKDFSIDCEKCGRVFSTDEDLKTHMTIVHTQYSLQMKKFFKCTLCDKMFTFKPNVGKHMKLVHRRKMEEAPLERGASLSPVCFSPSNSPESTKPKPKPAKKTAAKIGPAAALCNVCGIYSKNKRALVQHMQVHYGRVFKCDIKGCNAGFTEKSKLNRHMLVHTGEKRFECALCHAKFSLSHNMKSHMKVHEKEMKVAGTKRFIDDQDETESRPKRLASKPNAELSDVDLSESTDDIEKFIAAMEGDQIHL